MARIPFNVSAKTARLVSLLTLRQQNMFKVV